MGSGHAIAVGMDCIDCIIHGGGIIHGGNMRICCPAVPGAPGSAAGAVPPASLPFFFLYVPLSSETA